MGRVQQRYGIQKHGGFIVLDQSWVCVRPMPASPILIPSKILFYQFREHLAHQLIMWDGRQVEVDRPLGDDLPHSCVFPTKNNRQCVVCKATTKVRCKCGEAVCNPLKKAAANQLREHRDTCCYYIHFVEHTKTPKRRRLVPEAQLQEVMLSQE